MSRPVPDASLAGRFSRHLLRWLLALASLGLLVRFAVIGYPELAAAASQALSLRSPLLGLALLAEAAWTYALAQVYRSALLAFGGEVGRLGAVRISMAAFTLSRVLPGGGAAGSVFAARELVLAGNRVVSTVASMVGSWWISMTALSGLVVAATVVSAAGGSLEAAHIVLPALVFAGLLALGIATVALVRNGRATDRVARLAGGYSRRIGKALGEGDPRAGVTDVLTRIRGRRLLPVTGWAVAAWAFDATALWLAFAAFGHRLGIGPLLVGYGLANLISALPELTPGWLGVLEAALAITYQGFGVPPAAAVAAVLAYRLVSYWLPVAAGVPAAVTVFRRSPPRGEEQPLLEAAA